MFCSLQIFGTGPYAKVEAVTVKSNAHIKKMVAVQKNTKKRKFVFPYNQNNNESRQPQQSPKPKVVERSRLPPQRQLNPQIQPLMGQKQILKTQNSFNQNPSRRNNQTKRNPQQFYNHPNYVPQYYNTNDQHFQNGYDQQYVSQQQYMSTQSNYSQQENSFNQQQNQNWNHLSFQSQINQSQIQGFQNLNTIELMRVRQMIEAELYYLRVQCETQNNQRSVNRNFY